MKKKILAIVTGVGLSIGLLSGSGNHVVFDTTFSYDRAQIKLQDGTIVKGEVEKWTDYEGDQMQITIDGVTYLVHMMNVDLMAE